MIAAADPNEEIALSEAMAAARSSSERALLLVRLARLRGEHAVEGLLGSSELRAAERRATAAREDLESARADARPTAAGDVDAEALREQVELDLLGWEWEAVVAEEALEGHPDWIAATVAAPVEKRPPAKATKALDAELRRAIVRFGPLSEEVAELRAKKTALAEPTTSAAPIADERALARLRRRLIGTSKQRGKRRWYTGGAIDVSDALAARRASVAVEVEMGVLERISSARFNAGGEARARLAEAERRYRRESQAWAVHEAALARAKAKAARAREEVVLEPQPLDTAFEASLRARPKQLRAVFLRDTPFVDHVLYAEWSGKRFMAEATVGVDTDEHDLVRVLLERGAVVAEHSISTPAYHSWAKLVGGRRYEIALGKRLVTYVPHHEIGAGGVSEKEHPAPRSERGRLRLAGFSPVAAAELLGEWGIVGAVETEVPYRLLYRGDHRYGRLTPMYDPFASGEDELALPEGHMVLHGLTGVGGGSDAVDRLATIVETGGLKSIAERRRMELKMMTMSPVGDIASGIDMGVPTKIGDDVTYGGQIFFGMHPSILHRRDLWFSDRDFGGGHDRYPEYAKYAERLGQRGIHLPCPVDGRRRHLEKGLGRTNETYFLHEISWNDVDTLFVASEIASAVSSRVDGWKRSGLVPASLRVEAFGDGRAVSDEAAGWHVDEESNEVVYLTGFKSERLTLSDRIKRRAREIQREWDGADPLDSQPDS